MLGAPLNRRARSPTILAWQLPSLEESGHSSHVQEAKRFEAWQAAARELNTLNGLSQASLNARWSRETRLYDRKLLAQRLEHLRAVRSQGNIQRMLFAMRQDLLRNLGNMTNRWASWDAQQ